MMHYLRMGALSKKVGVVSFARLFLSLNNFFIGIIIARALTEELAGTYNQVIFVINLFSMIFIFGVPTSIYYFLPSLEGRARKGFFYQSVFILCAIGVLISAAFIFLAGWIGGKFNNPELAPLLRMASLFLFTIVASSFGDAILITVNRHKAMAALTFVFTGLHFSAVAVPVLLRQPLITVFLLLGFVNLAKFIVSFILCDRFLPSEPPVFSRALFIQQAAYIIPLGLNSVIDVVSKDLDRTLISYLFNPKEFAVYHYGALEIPLIGILISSVTSVIIPELARFKHEGRWEEFGALFRKASVKTAVFLFPLFCFLMMLAPQIYVFVYKKASYLDSVPIFRAYLFMLPIRIVPFQAILFALGRTRVVIIGALVDLFGNLALSLALVGPLGPVGVALGLVLATICQALFYLFVIKGAAHIEWRKLLDAAAFGRIIGSCILACAPCFIFLHLPLPGLAQLAGSGLAFGAFYLLSLRFLFK
ncbi:MAG TPA: oligosaccharide flippase family protein [Candidatus Sumerlaeota bacterium]|nr:oligosaccharide flippase family protein [Candidatus Sumerlaeota bacterium]HON49213.1 oligosaccharide flippase family protein [Candidatus Sumerlaeota bacterium]HOR64180.1 oligosaccharide flippase family protein [Candidatus Sumerlaeota bacterium]HPL73193.1 oligosaccharide flippase family protein [Candidatus Sumerlaeota bacterium]HRU54671.1 oligosaccharide flippase family protein [Candidatus Sumerlaeia bacterium]